MKLLSSAQTVKICFQIQKYNMGWLSLNAVPAEQLALLLENFNQKATKSCNSFPSNGKTVKNLSELTD